MYSTMNHDKSIHCIYGRQVTYDRNSKDSSKVSFQIIFCKQNQSFNHIEEKDDDDCPLITLGISDILCLMIINLMMF